MQKRQCVAVVGATGLVGERLIRLIEDNLPQLNVAFFGNGSVGQKIPFRGREITVQDCAQLPYCNCHYAMFVATKDVSKKYVKTLTSKNVVCIDNSTAYRMNKDVALVVPCINGSLAKGKLLIANPNCTTIQVAIALNALLPWQPTKLTVVTMQATSGTGKDGLADYQNAHGYSQLKCFAHPIYDNVIPQIGKVNAFGKSEEETKLVRETKKILNLPKLKVNSFCTRIPLSVGHCAFCNVSFGKKVQLDKMKEALANQQNVILLNNDQQKLYPMPLLLRNTKYVGVGRVSKETGSNALNMFVVADNLLRGASYNAYEILKSLVE